MDEVYKGFVVIYTLNKKFFIYAVFA